MNDEERVLYYENKRLESLLKRYSGRNLLQLKGQPLASLAVSPIAHKICVYPSFEPLKFDILDSPFLYSDYAELPFANDSAQLVILPHSLEWNKNAKVILREVWRVLASNGHVIILGVNPLSLRGLQHLFSFKKKLVNRGYFYSLLTLSQWIYHLGGEIVHKESFFFRPPLTSRFGSLLFNKLNWLEKISPWLFPYQGGIYLLIAQKKIRRLKGLGITWHLPATALVNKTLISSSNP